MSLPQRLPRSSGEPGELSMLDPNDCERLNRFVAKTKRLLQLLDVTKRRDKYPSIQDWCCFRNRGFSSINCFSNFEWAELLGLDYLKTAFLLSCAALNTTDDLQAGMDVLWAQFTPHLLQLRQQQPHVWAWLRRQWWHQQIVDILWHSTSPSDQQRLSELLSMYRLEAPGPITLSPERIVVVDAIHDPPGTTFARDIIGFQMQQFQELLKLPASQLMTMKQLRRCDRDDLRDRELVVFGAHTLSHVPSTPWVWPPNTLLANYECLDASYGQPMYRWMLRRSRVLDFSFCNKPHLRSCVVWPPCPTPCLVSPSLGASDASPAKRLFMLGSLTQRRREWLVLIEQRAGLPVNVVFGKNPRAMLGGVPRNAVVLNMRHRSGTAHLETVRLLQLVMNGVRVVSESAPHDPAMPVYAQCGVVFADGPEQMADLVMDMLADEGKGRIEPGAEKVVQVWSQTTLAQQLIMQREEDTKKIEQENKKNTNE